jgi:hypothetical protein
MADENKSDRVTLAELMVSNLAMTEAAVKLLIAKGDFIEEELRAQLSAERANYLAVLKRLHNGPLNDISSLHNNSSKDRHN